MAWPTIRRGGGFGVDVDVDVEDGRVVASWFVSVLLHPPEDGPGAAFPSHAQPPPRQQSLDVRSGMHVCEFTMMNVCGWNFVTLNLKQVCPANLARSYKIHVAFPVQASRYPRDDRIYPSIRPVQSNRRIDGEIVNFLELILAR